MYRFLLRMPVHLRQRLNAAAARSGRSLNAELVHRLEQALPATRASSDALDSYLGRAVCDDEL